MIFPAKKMYFNRKVLICCLYSEYFFAQQPVFCLKIMVKALVTPGALQAVIFREKTTHTPWQLFSVNYLLDSFLPIR